jgi:DNA-directed RNA polymerase specialized sigma24 family protein
MRTFEAHESPEPPEPLEAGMPSVEKDRLSVKEIEEVLEQLDPYIIALVKQQMRQNPDIAHPAVLDLEIDELVQRIRIKFWHALEEKPIEYPKAYVRRIVHSEFIDMTRRRKPLASLPLDQEGEIYHGEAMVAVSEDMADPACVIEERTTVRHRMDEVAGAVLQLPRRQRHVMICSLRDRVDNLIQLSAAFRERHVNIERWQWPAQKAEKQRLRASLSAARLALSRYLKGTADSAV